MQVRLRCSAIQDLQVSDLGDEFSGNLGSIFFIQTWKQDKVRSNCNRESAINFEMAQVWHHLIKVEINVETVADAVNSIDKVVCSL